MDHPQDLQLKQLRAFGRARLGAIGAVQSMGSTEAQWRIESIRVSTKIAHARVWADDINRSHGVLAKFGWLMERWNRTKMKHCMRSLVALSVFFERGMG